jgi:predicted site-specific integrase-resolvase
MNNPQTMTIPQAAKAIGLSEPFLRQHVKDGNVKAGLMNDSIERPRYQIPIEEVERIINEGIFPRNK